MREPLTHVMVTETIYLIAHLHSDEDPKGVDVLIHHEYDDHGNHRLRMNRHLTKSATHGLEGQWTGYQSIADLKMHSGISYLGFTEYFGERVVQAVDAIKKRA